MKPTDSSEEGHGRAVEGAVQAGVLAVAPVLDPATRRSDFVNGASEAPVRTVSGVVAAAPAGDELEEAHTTVDAGPARRFVESHAAGSHAAATHAAATHAAATHAAATHAAATHAALSGRIRHAMDRTLPLGTPAPDASLFAEARANRALHTRTMLLGGRYLTELGAAPEPPTRRAEALSQEALTPRAPDPLPPTQRTPPGYAAATPAGQAAARPAAAAEASRAHAALPDREPQEGALRASFVRPVGPPTVPPPRRRRTIPPGEISAGEPDETLGDEPAARAHSASNGEEPDHEAFALDRPRGSSFPPGLAEAAPRAAVFGATTAVSNGSAGRGAMPFVRIPDVRNPRSIALSNSVILPPPPQPHDYELSSSPSAAPPPMDFAPSARAASSLPAAAPAGPALPTTRPAARPRASLLDLPSVGNPLAGYEAPRETFWQRSLIVFVVALAVVGLFALGAIAFGFLGKTGW